MGWALAVKRERGIQRSKHSREVHWDIGKYVQF